MEDKKQKGIMLGGSDPNCSGDQYNFVPMRDAKFLDSLPNGYRFQPTDEELIVYYLSKKINGMSLPCNIIREHIKVYDFLPGHLFETYKSKWESEVYFFTVREKKKVDNGNRPNPMTGDGEGYWRATRKKQIISGATGRKIGDRRSLVYHEFGTSQGVKTPWLMHEYRIGDNLDEWVICKIYKEPDMEV